MNACVDASVRKILCRCHSTGNAVADSIQQVNACVDAAVHKNYCVYSAGKMLV
jgi:hypothetical protein